VFAAMFVARDGIDVGTHVLSSAASVIACTAISYPSGYEWAWACVCVLCCILCFLSENGTSMSAETGVQLSVNAHSLFSMAIVLGWVFSCVLCGCYSYYALISLESISWQVHVSSIMACFEICRGVLILYVTRPVISPFTKEYRILNVDRILVLLYSAVCFSVSCLVSVECGHSSYFFLLAVGIISCLFNGLVCVGTFFTFGYRFLGTLF
jgi:hypothetical protein